MRGLYSLMLYTSFTSTASYGTSRELPAPCERGALLRQRLLALSLYRVAVKLQDLQNAHCIRVAAKQLLWQADVRLLWDITDDTSGSGCHSTLYCQLLCPTRAGLLGFAGPRTHDTARPGYGAKALGKRAPGRLPGGGGLRRCARRAGLHPDLGARREGPALPPARRARFNHLCRSD